MTILGNTSSEPATLERRRRVRGSLDPAAVATVRVTERLRESADLRAGWRVLDVRTCSGDGAITAAPQGCTVAGLDHDPAPLEPGQRRAAAGALTVEPGQGDPESLPFGDGSFDAVISCFGCTFARDHELTAAELVRVARPGGTIALACWTPEGFVGELLRTVAAHAPKPAVVPSPLRWGTEASLRQLLGDGIASLEVRERTVTCWFPTPEHVVAFARAWSGPAARVFAMLEDSARDTLESELVALARRFDWRGTGAVAIPATYLEAVALTR